MTLSLEQLTIIILTTILLTGLFLGRYRRPYVPPYTPQPLYDAEPRSGGTLSLLLIIIVISTVFVILAT